MLESKLVPQYQYATLDEFKKGSNNFYFFFQEGSIGDMYRKREAYQRFEAQHSEFATQLNEKYKRMSEEFNLYCVEHEQNRRERFQEVLQILKQDKTLTWDNAVKKCKTPPIEQKDGIFDNIFLRR